MKIRRTGFLGLVACAMAFGAASVFAQPPPHHMLPPGMVVCPRCDGARRVPSGFLGLKEKRCPECKGDGFVRMRGYRPPMPPPPPPPKKGHHDDHHDHHDGHGHKGHR